MSEVFGWGEKIFFFKNGGKNGVPSCQKGKKEVKRKEGKKGGGKGKKKGEKEKKKEVRG